jgi:hypothetical protein
VKRRRRKKVPEADRQPLVRPLQANEVWSADFVFDRTAEGRVLKCLTIVDDATTEREFPATGSWEAIGESEARQREEQRR